MKGLEETGSYYYYYNFFSVIKKFAENNFGKELVIRRMLLTNNLAE